MIKPEHDENVKIGLAADEAKMPSRGADASLTAGDKSKKKRRIRPRMAWALAGVALVLLYAWLLPALAPDVWHSGDLMRSRQAPSAEHWFGTDATGRDLFVRVALGLRVSLLVAGACALISTFLGLIIGGIAAARGGWVDELLMRFSDAVNALPQLLVGLVIVAFYPGSLPLIIASIALVHWSPIARIVRSISLTTRELEYVSAARLAGAGPNWIYRRHLLPAVFGQAKVAIILSFPHAIWHESTLSFLGLGLSPDRASLGTLLENARSEILVGCWWMFLFPALALVLVTLLVMFLADSLDDPAGSDGTKHRFTRRLGLSQPSSLPAGGDRAKHGIPDGIVARDLQLSFEDNRVLRRVDFHLTAGSLQVIVGENGAGKSMMTRVLTGVVPAGATVSGRVWIDGVDLSADLARPNSSVWGAVRGRLIGVAPQTAATALAPNRRVGVQLKETLQALNSISEADASSRVKDLCKQVRFPLDALRAFPHELSGGMAVRAGLAAALAGNPKFLFADEITAGLDQDLEDEILALLRELADDGLGVLLITHDLSSLLRCQIADQLTVLRHGQVLESGPARESLQHPQTDYLRQLLDALPRNATRTPSVIGQETVLEVKNLTAGYNGKTVVEDCDLELRNGETLGIFGPSGIGKTTVARAIGGLIPAMSGSITAAENMGMLFQSPRRSVSPYLSLSQVIEEPLEIAGVEQSQREQRVQAVVREVGIDATLLDRRAEQVSDGQLQLVALGRALVTDPKLLICDEATAMLDALNSAHIVQVIQNRSRSQGLAVLVISHDRELLDVWADRVTEIA